MNRRRNIRHVAVIFSLLIPIWAGPLLGYRSFGVIYFCAMATAFLVLPLVRNIRNIMRANP
jgi:hypothetical protein